MKNDEWRMTNSSSEIRNSKFAIRNFIALLLFLPLLGFSQTDLSEVRADNGWFIAPHGQIHVMVVFAELDFDSTFQDMDPCPEEGTWKWKSGKLPAWKADLFSGDPAGDAHMTRYFRQASFNKFQVTGDYLDTLITVPLSSIRNRRGQVVKQEPFGNNLYKRAVLDRVNALENPKFAFGSELADFDRWTFKGGGRPKRDTANGRLDLVMLIWRNIHVANLGDHSGFVSPGNFGDVLGQQTDMYSIFRTSNVLPEVIARHEFSHMLYGGNNFHTANGGVGNRMFIPTVGGYSNMSASDALSQTWNGWDRERLGWKNPNKLHLISAPCTKTGEEFLTNFEYGQELCNGGEFTLRDFVETGDAIKIKLPHLPDSVRNQYLWIENHQIKDGNFDHDYNDAKGLYAYIQVGKDDKVGRNVFGDNCNYIWPLIAHGNYDFSLGGENREVLHLNKNRQNPLTGHHYAMRILTDLNNDGKIRITNDVRPRTEYVLPSDLVCDGDTMPDDFFSYRNYAIFGTKYTAFNADKFPKIGLSANPTATPVYTFSGPRGPMPKDNRHIYLNGISIEILSQNKSGDLKIRLRWDDFDIDQDVRWCGNIVSKERVNVLPTKSISLDQGRTPQLPRVIQTIDGAPIFNTPTVMDLKPGSFLHLGEFSRLWVQKGSTLIVRKGATVELEKFSAIEVEPGAHIYIEEGADIRFLHRRKAKLHVRDGAIRGINPLMEDKIKDLGPRSDRY